MMPLTARLATLEQASVRVLSRRIEQGEGFEAGEVEAEARRLAAEYGADIGRLLSDLATETGRSIEDLRAECREIAERYGFPAHIVELYR